MKIIISMAAALAAICAGSAAQANVPVNDSPVLSQRSEDKADKVQIKLIQQNTKSATQGVNCSMTTPKKADSVKSPSSSGKPAGGRATLEKANPDIVGSTAFASVSPSGSAPAGAGGNAGERSLLDGTGQVVGGMTASQETVAPNKQVLETMGRDIGSDKTLMEAFDRNSAIRLQGGMTFNEVIQATGFFAQAFNLNNINTATLTSRGSAGIVVPGRPSPTGGAACPVGTTGAGTAASPCVAPGCSTPGSVCVTQRYTDTAGNVTYLLAQVQTDARSAPVTLSTDELMSAVRQYQQ